MWIETVILTLCFYLLLLYRIVSASEYDKEYSPLSSTYTHKMIKKAALAYSMAENRLKFFDQIRLSIDQKYNRRLNANFLGVSPFVLINIGRDISVSKDESLLYEIRDASLFSGGFLKSIRGSVVLGRVYQSLFYLRGGYDYVPFGRNYSEIVTPHELTTNKSQAHLKGGASIFGEVGGAYDTSHGVIQGSFACSSYEEYEVGNLNIQYDHMKPFQMSRSCSLERVIIGGSRGLSAAWREEDYHWLANIYSDVSFSSSYSARFEYITSAVNKQERCCALHIEGSKRFPRIMIRDWRTPFSLVVGYESSKKLCEVISNPESNFFGAGKLSIWEEGIICVGGARLSYIEGIKSFFRLELELNKIACLFY